MNRLKHFIPATLCIIFACSFLFVSIESKAYYINCNLVGSRSGANVMESDILMGRDVIDTKNLIKTSKNTYRGGDIIKVKISNLQRLGSAINFSGGEVQVSEPPMLITLPPCSTHPCPDPPRYNEGDCGIDTTHYWTMDHNKGVPTKFILKLLIPKINPPKRISIAVLTSNENLVVSRQLKTLTLSNKIMKHTRNLRFDYWSENQLQFQDDFLYDDEDYE